MDRKTGASYTFEDAMEGLLSLLNPGPYGVSQDDPKAILLGDLAGIAKGLSASPTVIGEIAVIVNGHKRQTVDVDLLVSRKDALSLIRTLESSPRFSKIRIDRFRHNPTGAGLDLCVEGERTSPRHRDCFPSPLDIERLPLDPLPVVGLMDLLVLKAKSGRAQDQADFIALFKHHGLTAENVERIKAKIEDPELRTMLDRWHAAALEEIERDKLWRPPSLE